MPQKRPGRCCSEVVQRAWGGVGEELGITGKGRCRRETVQPLWDLVKEGVGKARRGRRQKEAVRPRWVGAEEGLGGEAGKAAACEARDKRSRRCGRWDECIFNFVLAASSDRTQWSNRDAKSICKLSQLYRLLRSLDVRLSSPPARRTGAPVPRWLRLSSPLARRTVHHCSAGALCLEGNRPWTCRSILAPKHMQSHFRRSLLCAPLATARALGRLAAATMNSGNACYRRWGANLTEALPPDA